MKKKNGPKIWIAVAVFMTLMVAAFPLSVNGQVEASGLSFGTQVGEYNGVTAYSNYENDYVSNEYNYVDGYNTGMKWQCVEYVNRYYYIVYGMEIRIPGTNAEDYYETASGRGLVAYPNGGTTSPQPGDILCSNGGSLGHVAIVREVTTDSVHVIHQNWANTEADNDKTISMSVSDGHYTVSGFSGSYPVQGWLRKPTEVIYVPDDYAKIQWAVDNASAGDTIIVRDGIYNENVDANKSLTIRSENGSDFTIVQAANPDNHVFEVTADYVNIIGFTVTGAINEAGIHLNRANCCYISNNNASNNDDGIYLWDSSNHNTITKNTALNNTNYGIYLCYSSNNSITNNTASNNWYGIYLYYYSNNNTISNNVFVNNGLFVRDSYQNSVKDNTVNGKPLVYLENVSDYTITDAGQLILVNCTDITVECLDLSNASVGIELWRTINSKLANNTASNNQDGIYLRHSSNNTIKNNTASNNLDGICLYDSCNNIITNNNASNNFCGILLWDSSNNNTITNNKASNNNDGIRLFSSSNNNIANNNVNSNDESGIGLSDGLPSSISNNNTITNNTASNNEHGICLSRSCNNIITNNNINSNDEGGIYLRFSNNNTICLNNFINNTNNVDSSDSTNIWNSTEKITYNYNGTTYENYLGNYWDDYKEKYPDAEEIDECGIWNTPYSINSDKDNYPLKEPFENYFAPSENIFDTGSPANPYPSIMGNHTGTIKPNHTVIATKLYTYPCIGTGGHTEYARIWNLTWNATATWKGYVSDWHNISFDKNIVLLANETYNYTIRTGSYPQIHHTDALPTKNGWINCTKFTDANGKEYYDWIPAIRLWS